MARLCVALDNIRSCGNVGAVLRTAKAFGFDRAYGIGTTPQSDRKEVIKVALGGESLTYTHLLNYQSCRKLPRPWICLETGGILLNNLPAALTPLKEGTVIIGSERGGIAAQLLEAADYRLTIPHQSSIKSLNVASSFAIGAYVLTQTTSN